ncbi:MAG: TetR/AcrR family transcriptional regulator [Beijerinckiaceae bacterium]
MARPRAHDYDDKRRLILDHAAELFAQRGYGGASIAMIAEACGVSKALLYHYYPDKEALLFDIIFAHLLHLVEVVETATADGAEPRQQLYSIAAALLEAYRDADAEHQVQINNLKILTAEKQEQLKQLERDLVRHFSRAIANAVPGLRKDLLKPVTMSLFGMLNWHYLWFREGRGLTRPEYARLVTELIISGTPEAVAAVAATGEAEGMATRLLRQ